jgi:CPA2 family monovalent cation:H+ antiporter-2
MFRLIGPLEAALRRFPLVWQRLDRHGPAPVQAGEALSSHVVVVGWGRVGHHIVDVLGHLGVPRLVVEADAGRVEELRRRNIPALFGDVANSEVLNHAGLDHARALVITLPDEAATKMVVAASRRLAPGLPIIARAATQAGVEQLAQLGAQDVIHPELEGGLEIVRHTLLRLGFSVREVQKYADAVRREHYDAEINTREEHRLLHQLVEATHSLDISWFEMTEASPLVGQTLTQANIRARTGASAVAILREGQLMPNPEAGTAFQAGDKVGLIGDAAQIAAAEALMMPELSTDRQDSQTT